MLRSTLKRAIVRLCLTSGHPKLKNIVTGLARGVQVGEQEGTNKLAGEQSRMRKVVGNWRGSKKVVGDLG